MKKVKFNTNSESKNNNDFTNKFKKNINNKEDKLKDFELNHLPYNEAIILDKRKFFDCYWSILKQNHLILFAILHFKDYNIRTIKISLLIISFSLYFTINCFFFSDDSMHKIYVDLGKYKIINQLPKMLYSLIISSAINYLLRLISLSGSNILTIKEQSNLEFTLIRAKQVEKCEKKKIILFYIVSFLFFIFFWYFISCFCAVYLNTQKILIYDTLISFMTSMIYPFGYYLMTAILRIIALNSEKKDKKCLYSFSLFL